jgi:excisionase family DNA binding protein
VETNDDQEDVMSLPQPEKDERVALSVDEAAALLGISPSLAYDLCARGDLPSLRLGRRIVVPRRALEGWMDRAEGGGSGLLGAS